MSFMRFISWLAEKLIELSLAAALLLAVKFVLPQDGASYGSPTAFLAGMRNAWATNSDEAAFLTHSFFGGQWWRYGLHVMAGAVWVVIDYFYVAALYGLLSLWARLVSGANYRRYALLAFAAAFILFCLRFLPVYDVQNLRLAVAFLAGGLLVSSLSAAFGQAIWRGLRADDQPARSHPSPAAPTGRTRLHFSE